MAKKSQIARDKRRAKMSEKYAAKRAEIVASLKNPETSAEERELAYKKLRAMPRDASATRHRNRCRITGRSRGYLRKFEMSRIKFRELAHRGEIPGVTKSSW